MSEATVRRLFELLLALYPRSFRHDVGADLVVTAVDRWRDARRSGGAAEALFWVRDGVRFTFDGLLERMRAITFGVLVETRHAWRQVRRGTERPGLSGPESGRREGSCDRVCLAVVNPR